jgi:hypothetical protein
MTNSITEQVKERGVTRLCHLTPLRNLVHIASDGVIRCTQELTDDERSAFDQQDLVRLDRHPDHICCSVQYPNVWYLRQKLRNATPAQKLFPGWVCILIDPTVLSSDKALFCFRNAAAAAGSYLAAGPDAFAGLYAETVIGSRGPIGRDDKPQSCPTDDQAEVLVPNQIPLRHANHVVVADEDEARRTYIALEWTGAPVQELIWTIAPELFSVAMSSTLRSGNLPTETPWDPEVML